MKTRKKLAGIALTIVGLLVTPSGSLANASTPTETTEEKPLDLKEVYWGNANDYEKPACVDYEEIVRETPEYKKIEDKELKRGTGEYWILMSQASDRVVKTIAQVGEIIDCDLILGRAYAKEKASEAYDHDITKVVKKMLAGKSI